MSFNRPSCRPLRDSWAASMPKKLHSIKLIHHSLTSLLIPTVPRALLALTRHKEQLRYRQILQLFYVFKPFLINIFDSDFSFFIESLALVPTN